MKIELFYREPKSGSEYRGKESLIEFETRVNNFMTDKQVIDIKIQGEWWKTFLSWRTKTKLIYTYLK